MLAAPLLAGNDLRSMNDETRKILTNKDVIAVDQDKLGRQGRRISKEGGAELWVKPLQNGDLALAIFNRGETIATVQAVWELLGLQGKHKVRDLWAQVDMGSIRDSYSADVASHGVVMLRIH